MPTNWTEKSSVLTNWTQKTSILNPWYYLKDINGNSILDVNGNNILVKWPPYWQWTIWTEKASV